jgi:hypothetical protein
MAVTVVQQVPEVRQMEALEVSVVLKAIMVLEYLVAWAVVHMVETAVLVETAAQVGQL